MINKEAEIINHLIGLVVTGTMVVILTKKHKDDPQLKIAGQPVTTFITLGYIGIAVMLVLLMAIIVR